MAQRIETITQHVFAFDDDEIERIIDALYDAGDDELAGEIMAELHSVDGVCGCSGNDAVEEMIASINKFVGKE